MALGPQGQPLGRRRRRQGGHVVRHEAGDGGGFVDLVGRDLGLSRGDALDWTYPSGVTALI